MTLILIKEFLDMTPKFGQERKKQIKKELIKIKPFVLQRIVTRK